jgi:hypothetical protein
MPKTTCAMMQKYNELRREATKNKLTMGAAIILENI